MNIPLEKGQRSVNIWISSRDLENLSGLQTNVIYENLVRDLGEFYLENRRLALFSPVKRQKNRG